MLEMKKTEEEKNLLYLSSFDTQQEPENKQKEQQTHVDKTTDQPSYLGFNIFKYTLVVEVLPHGDTNDQTINTRDEGKKKSISHYFSGI